MKFLNPSGLWMLLGVPVLIIIYLIKSKHEDRAVSSTYIWKLSDRFMKQRIPLQKLKKILAFLAQLVLIVGVAFLTANPVMEQGEAIHYIVILDGSASMQIQNEAGETRFDRAKEAIETLAAETEKGHQISLILATDCASCVFSHATSESAIGRSVSNLSCGNGAADLEGALSIAEGLLMNSMSQEVMIFSDQEAGENENIRLVNLSENEWNITVSNLNYQKKAKQTDFIATITDTRAETVTVGLKVDGKLKDFAKIELVANEPQEVTFTSDVTSFETAEVYVESNDGLTSDNAYAVCRAGGVSCNVLLLSSAPKYLENVLNAQENCTVTLATDTEETDFSGYDLYIFDGIVPAEIPTDGSVLYIHPEELPEGIVKKATIEREGSLRLATELPQGFGDELSFTDTVVSEYDTLNTTDDFQTLLFCEEEPVFVSKTLTSGLKEMVLSFDVHDSNLPLQSSFVVLMRNILQYAIPQILENRDVVIGESLTLGILPSAKSLYVKTSADSVDEIDFSGSYGIYVPSEAGLFTAVETTEKGGAYADFFVHLPDSELSNQEIISGLSIKIPEFLGEKEQAVEQLAFWFGLILLILVLGEWGLYYYEQF